MSETFDKWWADQEEKEKAYTEKRYAQTRAWRKDNRKRVRELTDDWIAKHPEEHQLMSHKKGIKHRFGITRDVYEKLVELQSNKCAICQTTDPGRTDKHWCIDHDHTTGTIRGLLCRKCNMGLGLFRDDLSLLRKAAAYLEKA